MQPLERESERERGSRADGRAESADPLFLCSHPVPFVVNVYVPSFDGRLDSPNVNKI